MNNEGIMLMIEKSTKALAEAEVARKKAQQKYIKEMDNIQSLCSHTDIHTSSFTNKHKGVTEYTDTCILCGYQVHY